MFETLILFTVCWIRFVCVPLQFPQFTDADIDEKVQFIQNIVKKGRSLKDAAKITKAVEFVIATAVSLWALSSCDSSRGC